MSGRLVVEAPRPGRRSRRRRLNLAKAPAAELERRQAEGCLLDSGPEPEAHTEVDAVTRETLDAKALRCIREGPRLRVALVDGNHVEARVRGTEAEHVTGYERRGWYCDCEAHQYGRRCSHLAALQLVYVRPGGRMG